jgi:hypothetical protein
MIYIIFLDTSARVSFLFLAVSPFIKKNEKHGEGA